METSEHGPQSGVVLAGKYRLLSLLGRGGMGSVWRAEHLSLQAPVAVKMIDPSIAQVPDALTRFHREAKAAAALRSPNVVQILDHGVDEATQSPFIVMELMDGESLADRLERQGRLSPTETSRIITQMGRALTRAHAAGVVHRDLKPDNVFLVRNEDEEIAKILDFGIAKSESHRVGSATATGTVMGTAYYMSPEQISGSKEVDHRTDLWAVAVIAHECLTGAKPFESETLGGMVLKICTEPIRTPSAYGMVPPRFDAWFERAVMRDSARRFQSAREMAEELATLCAGGGAVPQGRAQDLGASKTEWLDTGRLGLSQSGEVGRDTGGALSRTDHGATTGAMRARSSPWPWLLIPLGAVIIAGAGFMLFGLESGQPEVAAVASSTLLPVAAPTWPEPTTAARNAEPPEPAVAARDAGAHKADAEPRVDMAATAPAHQPRPSKRGKPPAHESTKPPSHAKPPAKESDKKPKSPFDGLLNSRK